jgi:hypothetical protein
MPRLWRQLHKALHQDGGLDEISVAGLSGALADAQTPAAHASSHQNGGADEISVAGLSGELADNQPPKAHKTSHQDGGSDEINLSGLSGQQIFVPYNGKIADIKEADTNKHTLELANAGGTGAIAGETRKIIAVIVKASRIAGTGNLNAYPNEGATLLQIGLQSGGAVIVIADNMQRLQYALSVANDDWDLYCFGYVVEA